jgi:hypothetical protein
MAYRLAGFGIWNLIKLVPIGLQVRGSKKDGAGGNFGSK